MQLPFDIITQYITNEYNLTDIAQIENYILIFERACTVFQNIEGLLMKYLKSTYRSTDINLLNSLQDYGPTNIDPYPSTSLWMKL